MSHVPDLRMEKGPVPETLCSLEYRTMDKVKKKYIYILE
jgi:hypothetical protein